MVVFMLDIQMKTDTCPALGQVTVVQVVGNDEVGAEA